MKLIHQDQVPVPRLARSAVAALALTLVGVAAGCGGDSSTSPTAAAQRGGPVKPALETLRSAVEAADPVPILATFADDIQLHSPALAGPQEYRGRAVVEPIVTLAMRVLEEVRVTDLLESGDGQAGVAVFDARIGGQPGQGVVMLRAKGDRVREITLLIRPLPALRAFVTRMGELGAQPALDAPKG